jgi:hypothetical protein
MTTIFAAGSRSIIRLPGEAARRIDNIIANKHRVVVGDAGGADAAIQRHLLGAAYGNVEVFCSGQRCRNDPGNWKTRHILAPRGASGFQYYAAKDRAMAEEAAVGLMVWDGTSLGTILNILRLVRTGKMAVLIDSRQTSRSFKSMQDWQGFLAACPPQLVRSLKQRATPDEWLPVP